MIKTVSSLLLGLVLSQCVQAQSCGTEVTTEDVKIIQELRNNSVDSRDFGDGLIPVAYHIIMEDDSTNGMDTTDLYLEMDIVNQRFAPIGFTFYQCGEIDYIYDSDYVDFEKNTDEDICDQRDVPNVLNIWFADNVYRLDGNDEVSICGYAYLSGPNDRVIIDNDCGNNSSTLVHEIGHYFSLLHTHQGGDELVDGSNCLTEGDYLCDTPADPRLSSSNVSSSCVYNGSETDANGENYAPLADNIMSYSRKYCRTEFTADQFDQMASYLVDYRNYLTCLITDVAAPESENASSLTIFPNPAQNEIHVSINGGFPKGETLLFITDITGRIVHQEFLTDSRPKIIDAHTFPAGVHLVQLKKGNQLDISRLIKL